MIMLFELGICFFEGYMNFTLLKHFLNLRVKKKWFYASIIVISMICLFSINQLRLSRLNLLASIIINVIVSQILFIDPFKKKIFFILLSGFILWSCELFIMGFFNLPISHKALDYSDPARMVLVVIAIKLLSYFVIRLICLLTKNIKDSFFPSLVPYFSLFPLSSMLIYIGLAYTDFTIFNMSAESIAIMIGCFLLWGCNIILFLIYDHMVYMMKRVRNYELTDIKRNLESQHYKQIEEINKKHSNIIHDMNNYLKTIVQLAEKENNSEIVDLINSIGNHIVQIGDSNYCNDYILNAILNGKKQEASLRKVEYSVYVEFGFKRPDIEDIDLISILSNLLDNAIEASYLCTNGYIDVQLYKANDGRFTTIKIKNNYKDKPLEKHGEFITKKQNPSMHGIGIYHVKAIVEKYGGWINIEYGEGRFCVTIMFA